MKIHEYQAKAILAQYNVPVPRGEVAFTVEEAEAAAKKLGGSVVVKAQIHAGGRGKGGGVKVAQGCRGSRRNRRKILGMTLVTHQTGPEGRIVQRLLIEETLPIERELYLGIVLDRVQGKPVFMASAAGGMDIEEVAAKTPELILKETLEPGTGLSPFQARKLAFGIGIPAASVNAAAAAMTALAKAYVAMDASLAEINPFILTKDGKVYALDAKINFDDARKKLGDKASDKDVAHEAFNGLAVAFGRKILEIVPGRVFDRGRRAPRYDTQKTIAEGPLPHRAVRGRRRFGASAC